VVQISDRADGLIVRPPFAFVLMVEKLRRGVQLAGLDAIAFRDWLYGPSWDNLFRFLTPLEAAAIRRALEIAEPENEWRCDRKTIDAERFEAVVTAPLIGRYIPKTLWWQFVTGGTMHRPFFGEILRIAQSLRIIDTAWTLRNIGEGDEEAGLQFLAERFTPAERQLLVREVHTNDGSFRGIVIRHWRLLLTKMREDEVRALMRALGTYVGLCRMNIALEEELRAAEDEGTLTIRIRAPGVPRDAHFR
jgi:hypothetical protein